MSLAVACRWPSPRNYEQTGADSAALDLLEDAILRLVVGAAADAVAQVLRRPDDVAFDVDKGLAR